MGHIFRQIQKHLKTDKIGALYCACKNLSPTYSSQSRHQKLFISHLTQNQISLVAEGDKFNSASVSRAKRLKPDVVRDRYSLAESEQPRLAEGLIGLLFDTFSVGKHFPFDASVSFAFAHFTRRY